MKQGEIAGAERRAKREVEGQFGQGRAAQYRGAQYRLAQSRPGHSLFTLCHAR